MSMPLSAGRPGPSERSHGKGRAAHPDSDYQSGVRLPWSVAERNGGSKRGGFTGDMQMQAQKRLDATNSTETIEEMLYVNGNPDAFGPDEPIVQEPKKTRPTSFKQPKIRTGVDRQSGTKYGK